MLELLIPASICGIAVLFGRKKKMQDKEKIELVFQNLGIGGKVGTDKQTFVYPKLQDTNPIENGTEYLYSTTIGLPDKALGPLKEVLSSTLNKPVKVAYKRLLSITVFDIEMPEIVPYADVPSKSGWVVPLGKNLDGWHYHDFDKIPHLVKAGTTRFGKTQSIKNMMTYLIEHNPDDAEFIIIDLKGKLEFNRYRNLKQVRSVCGDPMEAYDVLSELHGVINGIKEEFLNNDWNNILRSGKNKRLFVIVDEAAELAPDKFMDKDVKKIMNACLWYLGEIARVAGGLGVRLIYCTQYPTADVMPRQVKMNSDIKMSFRLPTGYASEVAIDEKGAEKLPSDIAGRALVKTHKVIEVQTPYITDEEMMERVGQYVVTERKEVSPETRQSFAEPRENGSHEPESNPKIIKHI